MTIAIPSTVVTFSHKHPHMLVWCTKNISPGQRSGYGIMCDHKFTQVCNFDDRATWALDPSLFFSEVHRDCRRASGYLSTVCQEIHWDCIWFCNLCPWYWSRDPLHRPHSCLKTLQDLKSSNTSGQRDSRSSSSRSWIPPWNPRTCLRRSD